MAEDTVARTWTKVGAAEMGRKLDGGECNHTLVEEAVETMRWQNVPCSMAAMPGLAVEAMIQQLRLPKVSRVGASNGLAPYSLIGVECNYKNGRAWVYALDSGTGITPLLSDFQAGS